MHFPGSPEVIESHRNPRTSKATYCNPNNGNLLVSDEYGPCQYACRTWQLRQAAAWLMLSGLGLLRTKMRRKNRV